MSKPVSIEFAKVPTITTAAGLQKAARLLTTSYFACRLDLSPRYLESFGYLDGVEKYNDPDFTLRALKIALLKESHDIRWTFTGPLPAGGESEKDFDFHNDPTPEGYTVVDYHRTLPDTGGVKVTFAIPTDDYDSDYESTITGLLLDDKTDPTLIKPDSFRRVTLENGGSLAFTLGIPRVPEQLHRFESLSPLRESEITFIDGQLAAQDPYAEYVLSLGALPPQE